MLEEKVKYQVYFVATPIGNTTEITQRAASVLGDVDLVYCEDTRHTAPLLSKLGITTPLRSYHKFNERACCDSIEAELAQGKRIAIVSDAGAPCVSDPGTILLNHLREKNISYTFVSGASALINAFALSGFAAPFTFVGFLPDKNISRQRLFDKLNGECTLIFYSAVHDITENLEYLYSKLGKRNCMIARELTKQYETLLYGTLGEITIDVQKGEFVIVIEGQQHNPLLELTPKEHLDAYIAQGMDAKSAVKQVAKERNVSKNEIYKLQ